MTVYVDDARHQFGRMIMCHMWADSLEELLEMASRIGLDSNWIQGHPTLSEGKARKASWLHFDISLTMKAMALLAGAVQTDKYGPVEHVARLDLASGNPELVARGRKRLAQVEACRKLPRRMWLSDLAAL
ncbi:DUF4031 domain-containing protein [Bosea vaviloviae]|uniref:DUF4031 domain-containing protein n=1 Tax=Bosea vaviloviae TaxID=1526658 RepID=A0A1D7U042_9HYPH|nr:DUF4031 domain-containing protein [Bosea vaviloviae]AOO80742.1 hypothetical protein BHK69_09930 [Bosea vaviloviae]